MSANSEQTGNAKMCAVEPPKPQVEVLVNDLNKEIARGQELVLELTDRLSKVLSPSGLSEGVDGAISTDRNCQLASDLASYFSRIESSNDSLQDLIRRIEL